MASKVGKTGLVGLIKRGWDEIPEVVGSGALAIVGLGLATVGVWNYYRKDGDNRAFKNEYVVYRDTDPRAAKIRDPNDKSFSH